MSGSGIADPRDEVPVKTGRTRQLQRRANADGVQPALGVERVGEREQVVLVGAAAVVEDQETARRGRGGTLLIGERSHRVSEAIRPPASSRRGFSPL